MKNKLILLATFMLIPTTTLHGESVQKNYVNWCSDPGSGGCPVARVPYQVPKNTQLTPYPIPMLVPKQVPVIEPRQYMGVPILQKAPNLVPNRVPQLVPQLVPTRVPNAIPNRVPNLEPKPAKEPYAIPYMKPNLEPKPIEQKIPEPIEQKIPGFEKTIGRPGEVTIQPQPKEIPMIEKREYVMKEHRTVTLIPKKYEKQIQKFEKLQHIRRLENKIIKQHLEVVEAVRGANRPKVDPTMYVLGGLAIAGSLALKRRK